MNGCNHVLKIKDISCRMGGDLVSAYTGEAKQPKRGILGRSLRGLSEEHIVQAK